MNDPYRPHSRFAAGAGVLLLAVLIGLIAFLDLLTPLGYTTSSLYLIPLVLTWWMPSVTSPLMVAGVCTTLAVLQGLHSLTGSQPMPELVARVSAVFVLWTVGLLLYHLKAKELTFRTCEDGFRNIIDYAPVLIWGAGQDGLCTFFNKPWLDFTGRSLNQELGDGWSEGVHAEDLTHCLGIYKAALESRQPFTAEYRLRRADGTYRWMLDRGFPQCDRSGHYIGYLGCCTDITDRKQAEEALKELGDTLQKQVEQRTAQLKATIAALERHVNELAAAEHMVRAREEQFLAFMDHLQGFAWIKDDSGAYLFANRYFIKTFGLNGEELIGKTDAELFPPAVANHFMENDRVVRRQDRALELIETFPLADKVHHGLATKFPLRYGGNDSRLIAGLAFDITERIEREDLLKRQAHMIDQIHDAVISTDVTGHVTSWNKGAERLFGYAPDEAAGRHLSFIYPAEHLPALDEQVLTPLTRQGNHEVEVPLARKSGEIFYAHLGLSLFHDEQGNVAGMIGYAADITDRKNVEEALRSREADLKLALDAAQMGTWSWRQSTNEVSYSNHVPALYGCRFEDFGVRFEDYLNHVHPEDREGVLAAFQQSISANTPYEIEHRCVWPDGTVHWLTAKGEVIWEKDEPRCLTGTIMDVTHRKEAESKLQSAHDQLRQLAKRLVTMEEEERGRLSRELHDEFAQILTGLSFNLARLVKQLQARFEPCHRRDLEDDIRVMETLVHDMIVSTRRIATGLRPSILDQLGLMAALRWLARDSEAMLSVPCEISIDDKLAQQPFDSTVCITVFRITQELLTNVARHAQATRVVVEAAYEAPYLILTVHDNGRGITEQELSNSDSLGLRGIRERVALLGGEVEIHGLPGEGTSVQARIPTALVG